jgi:hypothetical protein
VSYQCCLTSHGAALVQGSCLPSLVAFRPEPVPRVVPSFAVSLSVHEGSMILPASPPGLVPLRI